MIIGEVAFSASSLLGPYGGAIGIAFGAGATAGWFFAERTVLKLTRKQVDDLKTESDRRDAECNKRITHLENELNDMRERYTMGLERTIAQHRDSSYRMFSEGQEQTYDTEPTHRPRKRRSGREEGSR